jgi:hypothetical protein
MAVPPPLAPALVGLAVSLPAALQATRARRSNDLITDVGVSLRRSHWFREISAIGRSGNV